MEKKITIFFSCQKIKKINEKQNTTQYVIDTTIYKQNTTQYVIDTTIYKQNTTQICD
jgi:ribosomal protein L35AE/L33A